MKVVKLVTILMFTLLFIGRPAWAQDEEGNMAGKAENAESVSDSPSGNSDEIGRAHV